MLQELAQSRVLGVGEQRRRRAVNGDLALFQVSRVASDTDSDNRSEEHTSELQSLMRTSYAVFCLKKKTTRYLISNCIHDYTNILPVVPRLAFHHTYHRL